MQIIFLNVETYNEELETYSITIQPNFVRTVAPLKVGCRISFYDGSFYRLTCTRTDFIRKLEELGCKVADCMPGEEVEKASTKKKGKGRADEGV